MRLSGLVVSSRSGAHLASHASGRYEGGLRAYPGWVHGWHLMVSADTTTTADAEAVVISQRRPAGRALHGHQFGRRHSDQAVTTVRSCRKHIEIQLKVQVIGI